ncbi:hypothetical protein SEPCBS119000_006624 [Sporothrix epigloea]|uniref:DM2 domain-containing protein n=1 Tax=Sporothrix epigloea TaxID=1892477 RepID=A0ABP0E4F4_9PEZI
MTTQLTDEEMQRYTQLVDAILSTADLETVTRKKVRKGLEKALGGRDLSDKKVAIKGLIEARFDAINSQSQSPAPSTEYETITGDSSELKIAADSNSCSRLRHNFENDSPAKKKLKRASSPIEDADAQLAAKLQAQENRLARARTTRGGNTVKAKIPRAKSTTKKTAAKIDSSDVDGDGDVPKKKASGGFQKPFSLSYQLGDLLGVQQLSRPQVVKKLWEHIKGNDLQDPSDKRQIRCDDKMQAVFKQQKIDMFQMNKLLSNHLFPVDEE